MRRSYAVPRQRAPMGSPFPGGYYHTHFDGPNINPLSEGGRWKQQDITNTKVQTVSGVAYGTMAGGSFNDSHAYLDAGFGLDYEVEAIVHKQGGLSGGPPWGEVEILLRYRDNLALRSTSFGDTYTRGYEINIAHDGAYMNLGRWKDTPALVEVGTPPVPAHGDKFRARVVGTVLTCWWNDSQVFSFDDTDAQEQLLLGFPGIGFFIDSGFSNTAFGFQSVRISRL
jgi:hypothetical protein